MKRVYRVAGSLQVGIALLVLLTLSSLVGVIIPQGLDSQLYLNQWGTAGGGLLLRAGLDHLFSTHWYNLLLALFSFNVLFCTINRLRATAVAVTRSRFLAFDQINGLPLHAELVGKGTPENVAEKTTRFIRKRYFSAAMEQGADAIRIDARRGRLREVGSALLHFSLLPLLIGGLIGKIAGFSYPQQLGTGESAPVQERPFFVRCDFFELERNEDGAIKDYKSGLTLLDSAGDTLVSKVIEVNHPLVYKGIKFYQSSYRTDPHHIDNITLVVTGPLIGAIGRKVVLHPGVGETVKGTGLVVNADRFMPDFLFDMKTKQAQNRSHLHNNPALFVTILQGQDTLFARWVFQKFGAMHHTEEVYGASFLSYDTQQGTGLLIKENPGGASIWFGIIGMSIGVLLVFWVPRRRCWATVRRSAAGADAAVLTIGCTESRDDPDSATRFNALTCRLSAIINN
ncbi:MAG: cytochrome c biogenesis protein ResB [Chitinispirillaceae bacterium]|nr:cytochrome c biogenesis protein ResB [Chitinispirillaceae bacterium]